MKLRLFFMAMLFSASAVLAAMPRLTESGVEIDGGTMGKFIFSYPGFNTGGKTVKPEVRLDGGKAVLTYLADRAPRIEFTLDGDRLRGSMKTAAEGKLI